MPRPSTPPPPPPPPPGGSTLIFDFSDLPPSPEELAALQAQKKHRRLASLKARRRLSAKALSSSPLPGAPLDPPPPAPPVPVQPTAPAAAPLPEWEEDLRPPARVQPGPFPAPGLAEEQRKRGAQPGNTNALKYGFYSRRLPSRELDGLEDTAVSSLKDEIDVMRVFSRKVAELGADVDDLDEATTLLRVLSLATSSINRLVRTHTRIPDPDLDPALLLRTALLELEEEWPELKAFGDKYRNKPRVEPLPPDET
jgi:hypothetical protein